MFEGWQEVTVVKVFRLENGPNLGWEDQIISDGVVAFQKRIQHSPVSKLEQCSPQLAGQIHAARSPAFGGSETAIDPIALDQDVAVWIMLIPAELNVAPLQGDQFTPAQAGAQCSQEEWMKRWANFSRRLQKAFRFRPRQGGCLELFCTIGLCKATQLLRWVLVDQFILFGVVQDHSQRA